MRYPDVAELARSDLIENQQDPVLTIDIRKGEVTLRLFTTLATFGTPLEVAAEEIRVESFFSADDPNDRSVARLGDGVIAALA